MLEYFLEYLKINDVEYKRRKKLSSISSIKIGGYADIIVLPKSKNSLVNILKYLEDCNLSYKILGNLSNVLSPDENYEKIIIKTDRLTLCEVYGNSFLCECGVKLPALANLLAENGLSGAEELSGIPGQIGACIRGNAGAFGREIGELVTECEVYDKKNGDVYKLFPDKLNFGYRKSLFSNDGFVILSAKLKLVNAHPYGIKQKMQCIREQREKTQPTKLPSLGSIFKKTEGGISAGKLIDECGLRGYTFGGASISDKHAGFIVNNGGATSKDVKALIDLSSRTVYDRFGIKLNTEIEFL